MVPGETSQVIPVQCVPSDSEEKDYGFCIIRDMSSSQSATNKIMMTISRSTTSKEFVEQIAWKFSYQPTSFELVFQRRKDKEAIVLDAESDQTLEELGFQYGDQSMCTNQLIITDKSGESCRKLEPSEVSSSDGLSNSNSITEGANRGRSKMFIFDAKRNRKELRAYETPELAYDSPDSTTYDTQGTTSYAPRENSAYVPPPAPPPYASRSSEFLYNYNYNTLIKHETGLVGLVNQAMTCYLNSLLQTLYMTPEFRNAMYRWEFDGTEEEAVKSIPFQLQKLFLQLQTSKKSAVGTTELTTSFGWDSSEAWNQHDVQELCRVMFDALEQKFKNTEQSNLISTLYEGKLKDYVKCLQCGHESAREDTFLDVPLVVRPFGSSQAYGSVEEALHAFVTPEILEGSNQYFCEHCKKKCDAHKGLKFLKFPYLLTLQLKRFDFDPNTMHRIKLNDRVIFPEILNLNEFIKSENDEVLGEIDANPENIPVVGTQAPVTSGSFQEITTNERNLQKSMEKGPYVYELFSIMVHSGSANGGHYYAYIKSFKDGEWYCFNDAQVTKITYDDIQKTYGGGPTRGYYSSAYSSSTNAYMLMYRKIDKKKNADYSSEFPKHIKVLLKNMQDKEEKERQQKELDRFMCKIKLFCQHPVQKRMVEMRLKVHKNCTLAEATDTARKIMGLENIVPLDCCRLVKYDDFNDSLECSFDAAAESEPIGDLLGGVKSSYKFDLLLELKEPQDIFQEYRPGGTTVKMHVVNVERGEVAPSPITFRSYLTQTVSELKEQIAKLLKIDVAQIRLVLELFSNEMKLLDNPDKTLVSEGFAKSNKVFVEYQDPEDAKIPFKSSKFYEVLDCHSHTIIIHVALPKFDKLILEKLRIQEIEGDKEYVNSDDEDKENRPTTVQSGTMGRRVVRMTSFAPRTKKDIGGALYANTDLPNLVSSPVSPVSSNYGKTSSTNELAKKIQSSTTPDDPSQDCDEGLGDSEIVDAFYMNGCHSNQGVHSDQSEDSSLTDSERTLVGDELSPRNNSPDIMGTEMEIDAEPSQVAGLDSAKPESDSAHSSSDSNYQLDEQTEDYTNPSSPEENAIDSTCYRQTSFNDKKNICDSSCDVQSSTPYKHFQAYPYTDCETGEKMLRIYVDKRTTLAALKEALGPYVGVNSDCFKIYRLYSNNQEFECTRVAENLSSYTDDTRLTIKLGRALRKGEYKVKIYQLCINDSEPVKHLIDWVFVRGMTVLQAKQEILPEIKESCGLDIPLDRCRLRKKTWKNPGTVLLDQQRFEKEVHITPNWEVFLEILEEPEPVTSSSQITVFLRHWHPDTYVLDPFKEIVIEPNIDCLKSKISEISNIPVEFIEFAKAQGTFPCEISVLSIHNEIEWHFQKSTLKTWDLCVGDDGHVVYYRDCQVELKKLSEEEKRDILFKENAKTNKMQKVSFSPKKEKALKIYTVDDVPNMYKSSSNGTSAGTENNKMLVPDLD